MELYLVGATHVVARKISRRWGRETRYLRRQVEKFAGQGNPSAPRVGATLVVALARKGHSWGGTGDHKGRPYGGK